MVQPIQYQIPGVSPDPFAGVLQGLKIGGSLAEMDAMRAQRALQEQALQQQIQQRQAAMDQQQRFQQAQQDLLTKVRNKTATFADYQQVASMGNKDQAESALSFFKEMNAQQQSELLRDSLETMAALEADPAIGVARMREKATALRNSGQEAEAKRMEDAARIAELNPTGAVAVTGVMLARLPGGDKAVEAYTKLQADRRAAALQPDAVRRSLAEADKAVADAKSAQAAATTAAAREKANLDRANAEARKAEVEARVAKFEEKLTGGVQATADIRTAVAATNLSPEQKRALVDIANVKAPRTVIDMGAGAEAKARGESLVKEYEGLRDTAVASKKLLGNLEVAENILNKADFSTGFGTETKAAAASVLSALGVPQATQFATNAQTFLAQSREALLQKSILQKGTQTEGDAKRINETGAALGNTKDANKFILALAKTVAQRDIDKAKFYAQYDKENKTFRGADAAWEVSPEGSRSIFDYPAMRPFRNIQAPPAPAPARPAAAAPAPAAPLGPPRRSVTGVVTPAESFPVAPPTPADTKSLGQRVKEWEARYGIGR